MRSFGYMVLTLACSLLWARTAAGRHARPVVAAHLAPLGGLVHGDVVWGMDAIFEVHTRPLSLAIAGPLRFTRGRLRHEDWDEPRDFGKVLRLLRISAAGGHLGLRVHPLAGVTLGSGSLVREFYGSLDLDHLTSGVDSEVRYGPAGVRLLLDSFVRPNMLAGRLYLRPLHALDRKGLLGRIQVAAVVAVDMHAPYHYYRDQGKLQLDAAGLPRGTTRRMWGGALEVLWPVVDLTAVRVIPMFAYGWLRSSTGIHAGLGFVIRPTKKLSLDLGAEYRRLRRGYVGSYFGPLYAVDRYDFQGRPLAEELAVETPARRHGFVVAGGLQRMGTLGVHVEVTIDQDPRFQTLFSRLWAIPTRGLLLDASLLARGINGFRGIFAPARFLFSAATEVKIMSRLWCFVSYARDVGASSDPSSRPLSPSHAILSGVRLSLASTPRP